MNTVRTSTKRENIRKYQTEVKELKNTVTELRNTLEVFNSRLHERKEDISDPEDRALELT